MGRTIIRLRAATGSFILAAALLLGLGTAIPRVVSACSCVGPQPLAAYAGPDTVIFSGTVVGEDVDGVRVGVERWFSGSGAAAVVLIEGDFGNGASCGVGSRPAAGTRWLWVAFRPPAEGLANPIDAGAVQINICQPFADLATPAGAALLEEAMATFGEGAPVPVPADIASPGTVEETPAPAAPATPATTPVVDAGVPRETVAAVAVGGVLVLGVAVLGVVLLIGRRGRGAGGEPPR